MGYILQRLGGCVIQTPCCFASTILETPQKFFCLRPWAVTNWLAVKYMPELTDDQVFGVKSG